MPDTRRHRGPHPLDHRLFAPEHLPRLREAVADYSWLLGRGYATKSALALVGNRFQLHERQRLAVMRVACAPQALARRRASEVQSVAGEVVWLDGYNVLTTLEAALSGGVVLRGCDSCLRDIASLHGTFHRVEETAPALEIVGATLAAHGAVAARWLLDSPVSNSGRLKATILEIGAARGWEWSVELSFNPDGELLRTSGVVATADSVILDGASRWFNLGQRAVESAAPRAWMVDLCSGESYGTAEAVR